MNDEPHHDQLPVADYDDLPLGSVQARIRALDAGEVEALLSHERAHADRLPFVQVLRRRLEDLHAGAEPASGDPSDPTHPGP